MSRATSPTSRPTRPRGVAPQRTPAARRRLSMEARRDQLIDTAAGVFAAYGFKGTTTRQLAQAAGVTEAVIFQHFADKDALYAAVLARKAEQAGTADWLSELEGLTTLGDAEAVVSCLYAHILDAHERDPEFIRLMVYSALEHHALARRMQDAHSQRLYRVLEQFVIDRQTHGAFRAGPAGLLVRALLALPVYYVLQRRLFRPAWPALDRDDLMTTGVAMALAGLAAPAPAGRTRRARRPIPTSHA